MVPKILDGPPQAPFQRHLRLDAPQRNHFRLAAIALHLLDRGPDGLLLRRTGPGVNAPATSTLRVRVQGRDATSAVAQTPVRWNPGQTEATVALPVSPPPGTGDAVVIAQTDEDGIAADSRPNSATAQTSAAIR